MGKIIYYVCTVKNSTNRSSHSEIVRDYRSHKGDYFITIPKMKKSVEMIY